MAARYPISRGVGWWIDVIEDPGSRDGDSANARMEDEATPPSFGAALRAHRLALGLTQEVLAGRSGLGTRGIQDLERGLHQPHRQTVQRLVRSLALSGEARRRFELLASAGPRQRQPTSPIRTFVPRVGERTDAKWGNLPLPPTSLVGRERDVATIVALLRDSARRLVTLTGPGGIGKTRLALQVAADLVGDFPDGRLFVPLASLAAPMLLVSALGKRLGLREDPDRSLFEIVCDAIGAKQLLFVLDNFEPVVEAAPVVADLLAACPGLTVLVTSRIVLQVQGEYVYDVGPLVVPDLRSSTTNEQIAQCAAVRLFIDRAEGVHGEFALTDENVRLVAEICARVEGLPLAIELAAARTRLLSPRAILARLSPLLPLLTGGARDRPARHQTMRDTIAWSYDLLDEAERIVFRRLTVFVGGFTVDAALAIGVTEGVAEVELLNQLESLVGKSLLRREDVASEPRLWMLETIREFGREPLTDSGEEEEIRHRHAEFYASLAERADAKLYGPAGTTWLDRLEAEHDNLRSALGWYYQTDATAGLRLAASLGWFWIRRGHFAEGSGWLKTMLDLAPRSAAARAKALLGAGVLARDQGNLPTATALLEESLRLSREASDQSGIAEVLTYLGLQRQDQGNHRQARTLLEESLAVGRGLANSSIGGFALGFLGNLDRQEGDFASARKRYEEMLQLFQESGNPLGVVVALYDLGRLAKSSGDYPRARSLFTDALALRREIGERRGIAYALSSLGELAESEGDYSNARMLLEEALVIYREVGARECSETLAHLGNIARLEGDSPRAAARLRESVLLLRNGGDVVGQCHSIRLLGLTAVGQGAPVRALCLLAAATAHASPGMLDDPFERAQYEVGLADARHALTEEAADRAWADGLAMTLEQAIVYALSADCALNQNRSSEFGSIGE
jgi:predicted ATPase/transcriptional regulator with XRE-family HTH domain